MTTPDAGRAFQADHRLLETLQRVLTIQSPDLRGALTEACDLITEPLGAEKVDVFLYEAQNETLVALGTSTTAVGMRQHQIGMDRQPLANGGVAVRVFRTGEPYQTGHADQDPEQLRGMVEGLGVRSEISVPIEIQETRRGVLAAVSVRPEAFTEADVRFLTAVGGWIGLVIQRADLFEQATREAVRRGRQEASNELARITRRQQEIAVCIAEGLSNDEIAARLVLTPGTVANHIEAILRRLELRNRTQIGVWAVEHGLYRTDQPDESEGVDAAGQRERWLGTTIGHPPESARTADE
jgi:GAF domain-containing protein